MTNALNITAYPDIAIALDRALASPKGVRIQLDSVEAVTRFCSRVHSFRFKDRNENKKTYPSDHPMYGQSAYDPLMIRKVEGNAVEIIKLEGVEFDIEEIK